MRPAAGHDPEAGVRRDAVAGAGAGRPRGGGGSPCARCTAGTTRRRSPRRARRRVSAAPRGRCSRRRGCSTGSGARRGRTRPGATAAPGSGTAPARSARAGSPTGTGRSAALGVQLGAVAGDDLGLLLQHEDDGAPERHDAQRLELALSSRVRPTASRTSSRRTSRVGGRAAAYRSSARRAPAQAPPRYVDRVRASGRRRRTGSRAGSGGSRRRGRAGTAAGATTAGGQSDRPGAARSARATAGPRRAGRRTARRGAGARDDRARPRRANAYHSRRSTGPHDCSGARPSMARGSSGCSASTSMEQAFRQARRPGRAGDPGQARSRCTSRSCACSPRATSSSRTCPASARPRWPRRSPASIGGTWQRIQFTPDLLPSDVTGVSVWNRATERVRVPARRRVRQHRARRRDQPRVAEDAVGAARGDGGAPGHRRRRTRYPLAAAVHGDRDPEPDRARGHLSPARGAARPLPHADRDGLPRPRRRARDPRRPGRHRARRADELDAGRRRARRSPSRPRRDRARARRARAARLHRRHRRRDAPPPRSRCSARARAARSRSSAPRARSPRASGATTCVPDDVKRARTGGARAPPAPRPRRRAARRDGRPTSCATSWPRCRCPAPAGELEGLTPTAPRELHPPRLGRSSGAAARLLAAGPGARRRRRGLVLGLAGLALVVLSLGVVVRGPTPGRRRAARSTRRRLHVGDVARGPIDLLVANLAAATTALTSSRRSTWALRARFLLPPLDRRPRGVARVPHPHPPGAPLASGPPAVAVTDPFGLARRGPAPARPTWCSCGPVCTTSWRRSSAWAADQRGHEDDRSRARWRATRRRVRRRYARTRPATTCDVCTGGRPHAPVSSWCARTRHLGAATCGGPRHPHARVDRGHRRGHRDRIDVRVDAPSRPPRRSSPAATLAAAGSSSHEPGEVLGTAWRSTDTSPPCSTCSPLSRPDERDQLRRVLAAASPPAT